jgi:16S rRNA (guanine966-N2)-methyltransferase
MRIIAGKHRGRTLHVPKAADIRPTADRARQAVFNILEHGIDWPGFDGVSVLDLFAGTGAYGIEALSRGAKWATFVDADATALGGIRRSAGSLGEGRNICLLKLDATRLVTPPGAAHAPAALAFLDPPYGSGLATPALQGLASRHWLAEAGIAVVEVAAQEPLSLPHHYEPIDERVYGAARIMFARLTAGHQ